MTAAARRGWWLFAAGGWCCVVCQPCAPGTHYDGGAGACVPCGAGAASPQPLTAYANCTPCLPGSVTTDHVTCAVCAPGSYAAPDGSGCRPCPAGSVCPSGGCTGCTRCAQAAGAFAPRAGMSACAQCAAGYDVAAADQAACAPCAVGNYSEGGETCAQCPAGKTTYSAVANVGGWYSGALGATSAASCRACPTGFEECGAGGCCPCGANHSCVAGVAAACATAVPVGWYRVRACNATAQQVLAQCDPCAGAGFFTSVACQRGGADVTARSVCLPCTNCTALGGPFGMYFAAPCTATANNGARQNTLMDPTNAVTSPPALIRRSRISSTSQIGIFTRSSFTTRMR